MKGVPPEIDALMWRLAEEGGPVAQAEFEARHARYAPELSRRVRMVAELRAAGKTVAHRPVFVPRPARVVGPPRWAVGAAAGLTALAIGAVAYVAASGGGRPAPPPAPAPKAPSVQRVETTPPRVEVPPVVRQEPEAVEPVASAKPKWLEPRDVHLAETNLPDAIRLVAAGGGLEAVIAPGFEDKTVTLDYEGLNTLDTLKAMGEEHGFTVLEEEEGKILVVPAREVLQSNRRAGP